MFTRQAAEFSFAFMSEAVFADSFRQSSLVVVADRGVCSYCAEGFGDQVKLNHKAI